MEKTKLKKNSEYEVIIESLGMNGEGVAHVDGAVIFVPFALPGERVKIRIINVKSKIAIGKVIEIIESSTDRVSAPCPYFGKCGGCDLQHLNYEKSLEFKRIEVEKNLRQIGKVDVCVSECEPSKNYYYRNKLALPVCEINGETKIGMFRENSHALVEIDSCIVTQEFSAKLIEICKKYIKIFKICGYNEENNSGLLRHIVARNVCGFIVVTLVVTSSDVPGLGWLYDELSKEFECSLWLNINKKPTNVIFGEEFKLISGREEHFADILGLKVSVSPASFMQVNDEIRDKIYARVQEAVEGAEIVIDAFSGAGVMSGICSKNSKIVYGLEIVEEAVNDADKLAKNNNIDNLINICGDCAISLPKLARKFEGKKFTVILDPPRKGCDSKVIEALATASPDKIVYISCNSATLARDVRLLLDINKNYKIKNVTPFDMFPQTRHIETLLILEKLS